jgi:hypothetical protein
VLPSLDGPAQASTIKKMITRSASGSAPVRLPPSGEPLVRKPKAGDRGLYFRVRVGGGRRLWLPRDAR